MDGLDSLEPSSELGLPPWLNRQNGRPIGHRSLPAAYLPAGHSSTHVAASLKVFSVQPRTRLGGLIHGMCSLDYMGDVTSTCCMQVLFVCFQNKCQKLVYICTLNHLLTGMKIQVGQGGTMWNLCLCGLIEASNIGRLGSEPSRMSWWNQQRLVC